MTRVVPLVVLTLPFCLSAGALELDEEQTAVWQMEETYWRLVAAGNVEDYVALWHDDFVGWPCFSWTPTGKANIGSWVEEIRDNDWSLTYELKPEAVQLFRDVAVVHYSAEYIFGYGDGTSKGEGDWRKFTHTWMKVGDDWQIIGGMCANQEPVRSLTNK
jgi:ketosteroid isomerase-like protein